jgi:hypothetical protein
LLRPALFDAIRNTPDAPKWNKWLSSRSSREVTTQGLCHFRARQFFNLNNDFAIRSRVREVAEFRFY